MELEKRARGCAARVPSVSSECILEMKNMKKCDRPEDCQDDHAAHNGANRNADNGTLADRHALCRLALPVPGQMDSSSDSNHVTARSLVSNLRCIPSFSARSLQPVWGRATTHLEQWYTLREEQPSNLPWHAQQCGCWETPIHSRNPSAACLQTPWLGFRSESGCPQMVLDQHFNQCHLCQVHSRNRKNLTDAPH